MMTLVMKIMPRKILTFAGYFCGLALLLSAIYVAYIWVIQKLVAWVDDRYLQYHLLYNKFTGELSLTVFIALLPLFATICYIPITGKITGWTKQFRHKLALFLLSGSTLLCLLVFADAPLWSNNPIEKYFWTPLSNSSQYELFMGIFWIVFLSTPILLAAAMTYAAVRRQSREP